MAVIAPRAMMSEAAKMLVQATVLGQQLFHSLCASGASEISRGDRSGREPCFLEAREPAGEPIRGGRHVQRAGDGSEPGAPNCCKVKRSQSAALEVIHADVVYS